MADRVGMFLISYTRPSKNIRVPGMKTRNPAQAGGPHGNLDSAPVKGLQRFPEQHEKTFSNQNEDRLEPSSESSGIPKLKLF
jgi:hypothetical protein